jgi:Golgi phosphoprotein 3 (GPP34)
VVTLAEDLYLLAHDGATGRPLIEPTRLDPGLGGALLLDLASRGRVAVTDLDIAVTNTAATGEPLLDAALAEIAGCRRRHGPDHWVRHLARGARHAVRDRLLETGVLRHDDHRILRIVPVSRTHEADGRLHHDLVDRLSDAVVRDGAASAETSALALLALAVGLDRHLFPRSDRQAVRSRMTEVAAASPTAAGIGEAIAGEVGALDATTGIDPAPGALP